MVVDNRGDASHEGQTCGHVEVKMEGLAEPASKQMHAVEKGFRLAQWPTKMHNTCETNNNKLNK